MTAIAAKKRIRSVTGSGQSETGRAMSNLEPGRARPTLREGTPASAATDIDLAAWWGSLDIGPLQLALEEHRKTFSPLATADSNSAARAILLATEAAERTHDLDVFKLGTLTRARRLIVRDQAPEAAAFIHAIAGGKSPVAISTVGLAAFHLGFLLRAVVELDAVCLAARRSIDGLDSKSAARLRDAALQDPALSWLEDTGEPHIIALRFAERMLEDVCMAMAHGEVANLLISLAVEPRRAELTSARMDVGTSIGRSLIPIDKLCAFAPALLRAVPRRLVPTNAQRSLLGSALDRLLHRLRALPSESSQAPGAIGSSDDFEKQMSHAFRSPERLDLVRRILELRADKRTPTLVTRAQLAAELGEKVGGTFNDVPSELAHLRVFTSEKGFPKAENFDAALRWIRTIPEDFGVPMKAAALTATDVGTPVGTHRRR